LSGVGPLERREIAVLKAVGWRTGDVLAARLWENGLLGLAGACLGILAAYIFVFHAGAPGLSAVLFGWSFIHPPLDLTPAIDAAQVLALLGFVVFPFVAAGIVPAWRAATADPHAAMRGVA
jgi:ABC-type lipoprotein release transport system permease subunit